MKAAEKGVISCVSEKEKQPITPLSATIKNVTHSEYELAIRKELPQGLGKLSL